MSYLYLENNRGNVKMGILDKLLGEKRDKGIEGGKKEVEKRKKEEK